MPTLQVPTGRKYGMAWPRNPKNVSYKIQIWYFGQSYWPMYVWISLSFKLRLPRNLLLETIDGEWGRWLPVFGHKTSFSSMSRRFQPNGMMGLVRSRQSDMIPGKTNIPPAWDSMRSPSWLSKHTKWNGSACNLLTYIRALGFESPRSSHCSTEYTPLLRDYASLEPDRT